MRLLLALQCDSGCNAVIGREPILLGEWVLSIAGCLMYDAYAGRTTVPMHVSLEWCQVARDGQGSDRCELVTGRHEGGLTVGDEVREGERLAGNETGRGWLSPGHTCRARSG